MTQRRVRQIMDVWYGDGPLGYCGDEDYGEMASWYVSYHHQFRFDRQRGFADIELRGLPVLRAGSDGLKLPVGGNGRLGIPNEPTAVTLFQGDDADILNVLQQYGKPLVAPFRGLTAHQLHHLLLQLHARKAFGGGITAKKVVYGIALGRSQPRKEQYQNQ